MRPSIEQPKMQNRRLDLMGLANAAETRGSTGTGPGLDHQEAVGWVFGRFWNRTGPFAQSKPWPLAGYPDPLLTLTGVTVVPPGGGLISTQVHQGKLEQSCYWRAFQEPYDGKRQQLDFVPRWIQKVEWNVLRDGHQLEQIGQSLLQLFGRSDQPLRHWSHMFLLPQSCAMHWVPHSTACDQGTYAVCSSKWIRWYGGTYLLTGEIQRLVVEWTGGLVEFCHCYMVFDHFNCYGGQLELRLSLDLAVQTRHILQTIWGTRRNGQYIWVPEKLTGRLDQSLCTLHASSFPFLPFPHDITGNYMEKELLCTNNKSTLQRFSEWLSSPFSVLLIQFSTLESLCLVRIVNVNLSSVHGQLNTSKTFTCSWSSGSIALFTNHRNRHLEMEIHCRGNCPTICHISKRWYSWHREITLGDGKQVNIWMIKQL